MLRFAILAAGLLLCLPDARPLAAQPAPNDGRHWAVIPQIALGSLGWRWEQVDSLGNRSRIGPGTSPMFGAAFQYDPGTRAAFDVLVGLIRSDYAIDYLEENQVVHKVRGEGSIRLLRVAGSALIRMREGVPGFFTVGAGALYYSPTEPFSLGENRILEDETQWMPSAHFGAGIDVGDADNTFRIDARIYASRPAQAEVLNPGSTPYEARTVAFDFAVGIGYVLRF